MPVSRQKSMRRTNFSDRAVQGALLLRVVGQWLAFVGTTAAFLLFVEMISGDPHRAWQAMLHRHGPSAVALVVLAPIFLADLCKLSNRFAGPMVRLRREMHNLAEGREVGPLQFRDGDFWQELAVDFNRVAERMRTLQAASQCGSQEDDADGLSNKSAAAEFAAARG